jgi:hypothetical protein
MVDFIKTHTKSGSHGEFVFRIASDCPMFSLSYAEDCKKKQLIPHMVDFPSGKCEKSSGHSMENPPFVDHCPSR